MNKQAMAQEAISQIEILIQNLTLDNADEIESELLTYFRFLKILNELKVSHTNVSETESKDVSADNPSEDKSKDSKIGYVFERRLKGGFLNEKNVYVPENIIRKQGFENGDLISAADIGNDNYYFELVEKASEPKPTNRVQLNYCILSKQDSMLVASEYFDENWEIKHIKYNDAPHAFLITEDAIFKEDLEEGSIVDIAYYSDNVDAFRVIWKHNTDEIKHETPLPSSHYKTKYPKTDTVKTNELEGKTVLLLGGEKRTAEFERAIQNNGGDLIHAYGNVDTKRLESMVKSCDMLITMKLNINHPKARKAKEFAKKYEKPFREMDSRSISDFLQKAKSLIY
ncbi:DUF2325 domain-containing protein [Bacillus haynesii]|nr:DUF2325 domain-containing protein [Bacillus haynesii]MEC0736912.1 DUF2325 domain-containing protein [Bacillus haynesii]